MSKHTRNRDFDSLASLRDPNPLPCGCGIKGILGINIQGTRTESKELFIDFCTLHKAAPGLLEALKKLLRVDDEWHGAVNSEMANARSLARAAINRAEGRS